MSATYLAFSQQLGSSLGLATLPDHLHLVILGTCIWTTLQLISPPLFRRILPVHYGQLSRRTQASWDVHFVAFVHAVYATPMALYLLWRRGRTPAIVSNPILGYDAVFSDACAVSVGYFVWDSIVSTFNIGGSGGVGFVVHAVGCLIAFINAFQPFALFYLPVFLLWETSSIFLNIHWALDKVGKTGSRFQLINGVILLVTFFAVRIVFGFYQTFAFWNDLQHVAVKSLTPDWLRQTYIVANTALDLLNVYWFHQMIKSVRKRFVARDKDHKAKRS